MRRVLLVDDDPVDAEIVERALRDYQADLTVDHARTRAEYLDHLARNTPSAIVSDHGVPGCEGLDVFHLARGRHPGIPFIYLSGADNPNLDLNGLRALGVTGFVSKSAVDDLGPTISLALDHPEPEPSAEYLLRYDRLVAVVRDLSLARDLGSVMAIVRRVARELTGAAGATFVLREGDLCHYADEDAIGPLWKGQRFPMSTCLSGWAMTNRQPAVVEDIYHDSRIPVATYQSTFVRSVVMVPIRAADPIGAIGTYWSERRLPDAREVRLLQALADTTAVAMENVRARDVLEERVRERTTELESFAFAISHDLRAPIRHIQAYATVLTREQNHVLEDLGRQGLARISAAAERMTDMVDGLLRLSRMSRTPVQSQPVDLAELAREVADECATVTERKARFDAPQSLAAVGDPSLLRVVLQNLIGNAWKFTGTRADPRIEIGAERQPDGALAYFVRDNGVGFSQAYSNRLFGVFQRFHRQDEFPGTGVGLATVLRIVTNHGGRIWADSTPDQGATFFFTLGS